MTSWPARVREHLWPPMTVGARRAAITLFVLVFLTSGASYALSARAIHQATASAASTIQLCRLGNEARAQQIQLWTRLIALSTPPPHQTAAEKAQRQKTIRVFIAYVHQLFAPRNCEKAVHTP